MADWKELGKKALDVGKQATEKGMDNFQEWKNDPERLEKATEKKEQKEEMKRLAAERETQDRKVGLFHTGVHCPKCRSLNVQFMQNNRKGFSVGKAAGGAILTGGIGALVGFTGKKGKKNQWYCNNCGRTFTSKK